MKEAFRLTRRRPSPLLDHLKALLVRAEWFEFKPLFLLLLAELRARNAAHGGEEMMRLRTYEALQNLVRHGLAERAGAQYRGNAEALAATLDDVHDEHCREMLLAARNLRPPAQP